MFIDTHTHLYDEQFDSDRKTSIQQAIDQGVEKMYLPNCDSSTIEGMLEVEKAFPSHCFAMMGLHPCYVKENVHDELSVMETWLTKRTFSAIGEIGLDYHWDKTYINEQKKAFRTQIEWSLQYNRPIVIHTREATKDTIEIVKEYAPKGVRGVFHCFSGSVETARQIIDLGFYLGIGGVLTYKNAGLQEVVQLIDLKHIVLETDAPYLSPVPHRGKRNESSYTLFIAEKLANLKGIDLTTVANITTENALKLFGI
ncbi:MAG: TatD family hydrolase [Bacteroidetes bacterium]|jgi:TatD DNase family protein|nr:TatD family hydrolase [Bacteroidota bacterium]HQW46648.1 TatD family hydrolase [Chitinophagaceae bacterium]MBK6818561.1 TatD family hydrolase [Bacteroidota bacterium]MBK7041260.1 TatD family hydrolase [Bacteroidota bacterium]MBK8328670.1 TatD family hydrolase [Bacteroidota bacterium]